MNPEPDLIDRIATALPAELRADFYRELRHCRSLPENDEMLRILRIMQLLVVLMVEVPDRIISERQGFEQNIGEAIKALEKIRQSSATHQAQLDQRLSQLPKTIAEGITPDAIVATINESLRQQFVKSMIPETADTLAVAAAQIKKSTAEFGPAASSLGNSYRGAAEEARKAIANLESTCADAIRRTLNSAQELARVFREEYRWSLFSLTSLGLLVGIGIGMWFERWMNLPARP